MDNSDPLAIRDAWMKRAKEQTPDTLSAFFNELAAHPHDYNTICYACGAAAVAAATAMDRSPNGGITGFQAGAVMWEFVTGWGTLSVDDMPRFIKITDVLYPQYDGKWTTISKEQHAELVKKASGTTCRFSSRIQPPKPRERRWAVGEPYKVSMEGVHWFVRGRGMFTQCHDRDQAQQVCSALNRVFQDAHAAGLATAQAELKELRAKWEALRGEVEQSRRPTVTYHRDPATGLTRWEWHDAAMILLERARTLTDSTHALEEE